MILGSLVASSAGGILGGVKSAVGSVLGVFSSIGKGRNMNPERLENAQHLAAVALEGGPLALTAARGLLGGSLGMHLRSTAEGNGYFREGWQLVQQYAPALAAQAQAMGGTASPDRELPVPKTPAATEARLERIVTQLQGKVSTGLTGSSVVAATDPLRAELGQLGNDLRSRVADSVLRIGSGATTAAAGAIAGDGQTRLAVPVSQSGTPTWLPWALAAVVAVALLFVLRR